MRPHPAFLLRRLALVALAAGLPDAGWAEVVPAGVFADHLVLQRDRPIPVWGTTAPGGRVRVAFGGDSVEVTADAAGAFYGELPARPAQSAPGDLTFHADGRTVTVRDVVVGDVWFASGQSNMAWRMERVHDVDLDRLTARFPLVRHFRVAQATSDTPQETVGGAWVPAVGEQLAQFTAVGYYFARELHLALDVPIGLVHSSWGGTPVEAWMSPAMIQAAAPGVLERHARYVAELPRREADYQAALSAWRAAKAAAEASGQPFAQAEPRAPQGANAPQRPAGLFHAMVWPLRHLSPKGFIWYQGESNADRSGEYRRLFPALITGWRELFGEGDLPFYWVQLANFAPNYDAAAHHYAKLRAVQTETLALPNTGQAIAIDVGDSDDIHPLNKLPVGRRLARLALHRTYGFTELSDSGPAYESHAVVPAEEPGQPAKVVVRFAGGGKRLFHPDERAGSFEVAGADGVFRPATATLRNKTVELVSPEVPAPLHVRYAWRNWNENARLADEFGLPVPPFRTDPTPAPAPTPTP